MEILKKKILFLSANPVDTERKRFDEECREIDEGLKRSKCRDAFEFKPQFAVDYKGIRRALLDHNPQIVHFCGHCTHDGIKVEDKTGNSVILKSKDLADLFDCQGNIECVLLNAGCSEEALEEINKKVEYVIGICQPVPDKIAIEFAVAVYDAIGAKRTFENAFSFAENAMQLYSDIEVHTSFKKRSDEDSSKSLEKDTFTEKNSYDNSPITLAIRSFKHKAQDDIENKADKILCLCDHFKDRKLVKGTWEEVVQKIVSFISQNIKSQRRYHLYLPLHSSLAFLVGRTIDPKCGAEINIYQQSQSSPFKLWQLSKDFYLKTSNPWIIEESVLGNFKGELAAALSVTHNIQSDVEAYVKAQHPNISHLVHLKLSVPIPHAKAIKDENHAYEASLWAITILREKYRQIEAPKLNLFLSAPNIFTFMLGQQSHVLRNITLYEYNLESGKLGDYTTTCTL